MSSSVARAAISLVGPERRCLGTAERFLFVKKVSKQLPALLSDEIVIALWFLGKCHWNNTVGCECTDVLIL